MELRDWAQALLCADTLAGKLSPAGPLTDAQPAGAVVPPRAPGRPAELVPGAGEASPPSPKRLGDASERARALHAFANHELLAIECMAAALLRFTEAPPRLRRGLATIISDEQRHLALYLERLETYGHRFGDWPVNDVFWQQTRALTDPADFLAVMGLTFEQANLDFAATYAEAFRALGDEDTAVVLERVQADEVRHVRHGVHWLSTLDERPLWRAWTERLPAPLTPARGRGPQLCREVRLQAGLDAAFVDRLEATWLTKGRPPVVWDFTYWCEEDIAAGGAAMPKRRVRELGRDLSLLPVVLAGRDDIVVASRLPGLDWRRQATAAGLFVPELVLRPDSWQGHALRQRTLDHVEPWGWSPTERRRLAPLGRVPPTRWDELFGKDLAVEVLREVLQRLEDPRLGRLEDTGVVCRSVAEVDAARGRWPRTLIKARLGTSGRNQVRGEPDPRWLERVLARQGAVVVEPLLERVADLSFQLQVGEEVRFCGMARPDIDASGTYRGSVLGDVKRGLPQPARRFLAGDGRDPGFLDRVAAAVCAAVAQVVTPLGFHGPVGVDALLVRQHGELVLRPVLELNPRWNMGRVALEISRRLAPGRSGLLRLLAPADLGTLGMRVDRQGWQRGRVALADPALAHWVVPVVEVS